MKRENKQFNGWYIVIAATVITFVTVGMRMSTGPFFLPLTEHFLISRTKLSAIIAAGMLVYGIGMPLAGYCEKRFGTKLVLLSGAAIVLLSTIWMVYAKTALELFFSFGIFLSLGLAFTSPVALTPLIARWFVKKRGEALFYLATGSMAGIAVMNPVFTKLIATVGWEKTMLVFVSIFLLMVIPTALFVIREPEEQPNVNKTNNINLVHHELTLKEAVKTRPFWQICIGLFACGYSMNLIGSHGVPMLVDHGFPEMTASFAIGLIGLVAIAGTLLMGKLSDLIARKKILAMIYLVRGIGFVFLVFAVSSVQLYTVAIVAGFVWAGSNALSSAILTDLYDVKMVGVLYGWAYFSHQVAAMFSSFLGGWGYEQFGTHLISFGIAAVLLLLASVISARIPTALKDKKMSIYEEKNRA